MKKKKSGGGGANWMDTYGDMVTLLLCFFVMLYSMSTLDKEKWIALVQSFNPTEEVTETQPPSASGGEGTGTQEDIDQDMEELYQAMQDYVQQAGMANQVTWAKETATSLSPLTTPCFLVETATNCGMRARLYWTKSPRLFQRSAAPSTRSVSWVIPPRPCPAR